MGNLQCLYNTIKTIVVAILISSRFVCIVFSPKYGFASLLGCTVYDVTLAADVGRNPEDSEKTLHILQPAED